MRTWLGVIAAFTGLIAPDSASVCSCALPGPVRAEIAEATAVFRGLAIDVEQRPTDGDATGRYVTERATLEVLEVWKGSFNVGDHVLIQSSFGPGQCGLPVRNSPVTIEEDRPDGTSVPMKISGEWIVFARGEQPFEISICTLSQPIEGAGGLAKELRGTTESDGT